MNIQGVYTALVTPMRNGEVDYDTLRRYSHTDTSVPAEFCRGSDDLCSCGRTDPGDVRGRALQHRNHIVFCRIYSDDGAGRSAGLAQHHIQ